MMAEFHLASSLSGVLVMRMLACWRTTKAALMLLVTPVPSPAGKSQNVCCEIGPGLFVSKGNRNAQFPPAGFNGSLILPLISIKRKMERHGLRGWAEENIAKDLFCFFLQMLCEIECEKCNLFVVDSFLKLYFLSGRKWNTPIVFWDQISNFFKQMNFY